MASTSKNDQKNPNLKKQKKNKASTVAVKVKEEFMEEQKGTSVVNGVVNNNSDSSDDEEEFKPRADVLKRRSKRLKHLAKIYKDYYWSLIEELKTKHRDYVWNFGTSPSHEHPPQGYPIDNHNHNHNNDLGINNISNNGPNGIGIGNGIGGNGNCEVHSCKKKAMALTRFCHAHILSDANQVLYKGCKYPTKSSPSGPTLCMKPIIKSAVPSLCSNHLEKAEKHLSRCLRKEGFTGSGTNKQPLKFNVVVAEFVRQIQTKRKESL